jgi:hypothetical protein
VARPAQDPSLQRFVSASTAGARTEEPPKPLRKKYNAARAARVKKLVLGTVLVGSLGGATFWALTTPRMAVSGVNVTGVGQTPSALLNPVAQALLGQNWLRADMAAAQSRLTKLPTVQSAKVSRSWTQWPPRLSMSIQERSPWVRLGGGNTWWVIDRLGIAYRTATRSDSSLYAITSTALDTSKLRAGQPVPGPVWGGVRRLATALDQSSRQDGRWNIRRAYLDRDNMASLRLQGGSQDEMLVRLGDSMWASKMSRARRALAFFEAAGRRATSLNLVSFSMPTWTPLQPRPEQAKDEESKASSGTLSSADSNTSPTTPEDASAAAPTGAASTSSPASATRESSKSGKQQGQGAGGADSSAQDEADGADSAA